MQIRITVFIFFFSVFAVNTSKAQQSELLNVENITDCYRAMKIDPTDSIGFTTSPPGSGKIIEYRKNPQKSLYYFEDEHHTSWYRFQIPFDGFLAFDIIPLSIEDDYDFILYKYTDSGFCTDVKARKILPVRSAISRNDKSIGSRTGLSFAAGSDFIHSGPGASYSNAIQVKTGEAYYLVLDNCYKNGKGHKIVFDLKKGLFIKGRVVDQQSAKPIIAEVCLISLTKRDTIATTLSDLQNGDFYLHGLYHEELSVAFELTVNSKGYFYYDTIFNFSDDADSQHNFIVPLPRLEKGKNIRINNINFYGNTTIPYPETKYIFIKLLKVMQNNPSLIIQIEGHTNGCRGGMDYSQNLSDARSKAVRNYLLSNGISPKKIYTIGYGCSKMIYADPKNEIEGKLNRRVEIKILSF
jgi:outer membrane protein OmpA-like peptidoglycan-associated protein